MNDGRNDRKRLATAPVRESKPDKMEKLSFTLLEKGNSEAPNIGTIFGKYEDELVYKATKAIESHFDGEVTSLRIQDGLTFKELKNSPPVDLYVTIDGEPVSAIEIQQTWLY